MRSGKVGLERSNTNAGAGSQNGGSLLSRPTSHVMPVQNQNWMLEALRMNTTTTTGNMKSDLRQGKLDINLSRIGLAPNKAAYREQIKAVYGISDKPMSAEDWIRERATIVDAEPLPIEDKREEE